MLHKKGPLGFFNQLPIELFIHLLDRMDMSEIENLALTNKHMFDLLLPLVQRSLPHLSVHLLAAADNRAVIALNNGDIYRCGHGQIKDAEMGTPPPSSYPVLIDTIENILEIVMDNDCLFVLTKRGDVYACGWNIVGQLGFGDTQNRQALELVTTIKNVKQIVTNNIYTLFLTCSGQVYECGSPDEEYVPKLLKPMQIAGLKAIQQIVSNDKVAYFLTEAGDVWSGSKQANTPLKPRLVTQLTDVKRMFFSAGDNVFFLLQDGRVMVSGKNEQGQLGVGDRTPRDVPEIIEDLSDVKNIVINFGRTFFLLKNGQVKACGSNTTGILGFTETYCLRPRLLPDISQVAKIMGSASKVYFLKTNGKIVSLPEEEGYCELWDQQIKDIVSSNTINESTYVIFEDGTWAASGSNNCGQLGLGHQNPLAAPEKVFLASIQKHLHTSTSVPFMLALAQVRHSYQLFYYDNVISLLETKEKEKGLADFLSGKMVMQLRQAARLAGERGSALELSLAALLSFAKNHDEKAIDVMLPAYFHLISMKNYLGLNTTHFKHTKRKDFAALVQTLADNKIKDKDALKTYLHESKGALRHHYISIFGGKYGGIPIPDKDYRELRKQLLEFEIEGLLHAASALHRHIDLLWFGEDKPVSKCAKISI